MALRQSQLACLMFALERQRRGDAGGWVRCRLSSRQRRPTHSMAVITGRTGSARFVAVESERLPG